MDNILINENADKVIGIGKASKPSDIATVAYKAGIGIDISAVVLGLAILAGGIAYASGRGSFQDVSKYRSLLNKFIGVLIAMIVVLGVGSYMLPDFNFLDLSSNKKDSAAPSASTLSGPVSKGTTQNTNSPSCSNPEQMKQTLARNGGQVCSGAVCKGVCRFDPGVRRIAIDEAQKAGVEYGIVLALICRESSGIIDKIGTLAKRGVDCGLMQINSTTCTQSIMDPATNIRLGIDKYKKALASASSYNYVGIQKQTLAFASYNCCVEKTSPNAASSDCNTKTGWVNDLPRWACPTNPGEKPFNMCDVKNYACDVTACSTKY